jgi:hypothetical protein
MVVVQQTSAGQPDQDRNVTFWQTLRLTFELRCELRLLRSQRVVGLAVNINACKLHVELLFI